MWGTIKERLLVIGGVAAIFGFPIMLFIMIITAEKMPEPDKKPTFQETCIEEGGKLITHHHDFLFNYDTYSCEKGEER